MVCLAAGRAIAAMAIAHGAWPRAPNGLITQTRQSAHLVPVARDQDGSGHPGRRRRALMVLEIGPEVAGGRVAEIVPAREPRQGVRFRPAGGLRVTPRWPARARRCGRRPSPCQKGIFPGSPALAIRGPGRGRFSSMRQVLAPRRNVSALAALEDHISSSSSPPAPAPGGPRRRRRVEAAVGDGAAVGNGDGTCALRVCSLRPAGPRWTRGLRSANSSGG